MTKQKPTAQKQRITRQLEEIGAGWVQGPDKYIAGKYYPEYHIWSDKSYSDIESFATLVELEVWIREHRTLKRRDDAPARDWPHTTLALPDKWREGLKRRFGNVQAAVEWFAKNELGPLEGKEKNNG